MWPPEVERIAALVRAIGAEARLEELAPVEGRLPAPAVRAWAYLCGRAIVVTLLPVDHRPDTRKVAAEARCRTLTPAAPPPFPYDAASEVLLERLVLAARRVWIEANSPRHVLALDPAQLARLTRARTADLVQEGEVHRRAPR